MVWFKGPNCQIEYLVDSAHKRDVHTEVVDYTDKKETVDLRTAKAVDVKDVPFLRDYYLQKYQKEIDKYQDFINSLK